MVRRFAQNAALVFALLSIAGCFSPSFQSASSSYSLEESLIYYPTRYPFGEWSSKDKSIEDAWFETPDGLRLHGWFAEAKEPRAVVLYAHGNAGNVSSSRWALDLFREGMKTSVLVFDYRGYGRSEGRPNEKGILEDARAARRWLAKRTGMAEKDIVLVGHSLGGAVVVDLAARDGARGLVLENTLTSMPEVAASHFKLLPVHWLMKTRLDSAAKIGDYHGPLLQTHGDADRTIPFQLGKKLFQLANEPKQFVPIAGGGHNDPPTRTYLLALDKFLDELRANEQSRDSSKRK